MREYHPRVDTVLHESRIGRAVEQCVYLEDAGD